MDELDEPIQFELRTKREVAAFMFATGLGAAHLLRRNRQKGAQTCSNLQIRVASADPQRVASMLEDYSDGGLLTGEGAVSSQAAIGQLASEEEVDPDSVTEGQF